MKFKLSLWSWQVHILRHGHCAENGTTASVWTAMVSSLSPASDFIRLITLYAKTFGFLCPKFSIEMCWWKSSQRGSSPSTGDSEQRLRHVRLFPQHSCHHQLPGDRQRKKPTLARLPGRGRNTKWRGRPSGSEEVPICSFPPHSDCGGLVHPSSEAPLLFMRH